MAIGDGIRRNVATISQAERYRLIYAFLALDTTQVYPDGVTHWDKQEDIHKSAHAGGADVHGGPAFLPWHREICNRLEALLREVDPALTLHYWDWTTDPRPTLLKPEFMGSASGDAGFPLQNFESTEGGGKTKIWRSIISGGAPGVPSDNTIVTSADGAAQADQYHQMRIANPESANLGEPPRPNSLENAHNNAHGYIGGSIGQPHFSFHDPFVFLLHSNVDRLWAKWQSAPGKAWRLDPNKVYGSDGSATSITDNLQPWDGSTNLRPWAPPENQQVAKNCKHPSVVAPPLYDFAANEQSDWRWCNKCQGMFFGGNPGSKCPAGGAHVKTGSGNYVLAHNVPPSPLQADWRWCSKCQGMFFGGNPGSKCPAGGGHIKTGSGNYSMWNNAPGAHGQADWRWCDKCQGMFFGGNAGSVCPAGGAHVKTGSGNYRVVNNLPGAPGQADWRWCNKCQGMFFGGNPGSKCPAGGAHVKTGSGNYAVLNNIPSPPDQSDWRWCKKCQGLFFGGNPGSICPTGGAHDSTGSGNYSLLIV